MFVWCTNVGEKNLSNRIVCCERILKFIASFPAEFSAHHFENIYRDSFTQRNTRKLLDEPQDTEMCNELVISSNHLIYLALMEPNKAHIYLFCDVAKFVLSRIFYMQNTKQERTNFS